MDGIQVLSWLFFIFSHLQHRLPGLGHDLHSLNVGMMSADVRSAKIHGYNTGHGAALTSRTWKA